MRFKVQLRLDFFMVRNSTMSVLQGSTQFKDSLCSFKRKQVRGKIVQDASRNIYRVPLLQAQRRLALSFFGSPSGGLQNPSRARQG